MMNIVMMMNLMTLMLMLMMIVETVAEESCLEEDFWRMGSLDTLT
jgi:hypothetical protein